MVPTNTVFERMLSLLGADTATVGTVDAPTNCQVMLIKSTFVPGPTTRLADLDEADFDGYAQVACAGAPKPQSNDPSNGDSILTLTPSTGGFTWETTGLTNLPQTIFGYAVIGHGPEIVGSALITPTVTLNGINQSITVATPTFHQPQGTIN